MINTAVRIEIFALIYLEVHIANENTAERQFMLKNYHRNGQIIVENTMAELYEIRLSNLLKLVNKAGGQSALSGAVGLHPTYVNHVIRGRRNLGNSLSRKLEQAMKLPKGWMDSKH